MDWLMAPLAMGLIFCLMLFQPERWQYVQCILCGLTGILLCVLFFFADSESVDMVVAHDGFLL